MQADTQTTVTMLCLVGLHVLDKKKQQQNKKRWQNKKSLKRKSVTKIKKNVKKTFLHLWLKPVNTGIIGTLACRCVLAWWASSTTTTCCRLNCVATCSGVSEFRPSMSTLLHRSSSVSTTAVRPYLAATCSDVKPRCIIQQHNNNNNAWWLSG